jgi:peptide/nickel transport system permease protein
MASPQPAHKEEPRRNWAILIGSVLALLVILVAFFGPAFSPNDPMQESFIAEHGDRFLRPPFPPGVEGFPLGSDEFGRDILSRLLWAVRPTMTLVLVVAALRMFIGITVGLISGWTTGRISQFLDSAISAALSIPVLFVALCIIAAFASKWGVWAFILGLSITGWAEAARLVHEQTRSVRGQAFIEATRAMGAGGPQIVMSHIVPHILPMIWIQLAFEVSTALLTTAALGFLGYFINAIWVPVADFTGLRAAGAPELGQMLGISTRNQPWTAVFAGTMVFLIVLAFNLLGEGLRMYFNPERRRKSQSAQVVDKAGSWVEERLYLAATEWRRTATTGGAFAALVFLLLGGGWFLWQTQNSGVGTTKINVPGEHYWASVMRDPHGTYWSSYRGPMDETLAWSFKYSGLLNGGPVVDRDNNIYINSANKHLISVDVNGVERWQVELPETPFGTPALTADGNVVIVDAVGDLTAFNPEGTLMWHYQSNPPDTPVSSPLVGPNGIIYYSLQNFIVAVDANGQLYWQIRIPTYSYSLPMPRLSPDAEYLFFEDFVIDANTGQVLFRDTPQPMDVYLTGANGKSYFRNQDGFSEWTPTETGAVLSQQAKLETRALGTSFRFTHDAGVSPSGHIWILYASQFEYARVVWTDPSGQSPQISDFPYRPGFLIGIDSSGVGYVCGMLRPREPYECRAVQLNSALVLWKASVETRDPILGGALADGRLYITTLDGHLYAYGR